MTTKIWITSLRGFLGFAVCGLVAWPAQAAIELAETVAYVQGAQPADAACSWEAALLSATATRSQGAITLPGKTAAASGLTLFSQVARLDLARSTKENEYTVVIRGNVSKDGKLLATRDFQDDKSFKPSQPACDALQALGTSLGASAADWVAQTRFMDCGDGCAGIHPDETIVVGAEVLADNAEALNDTVRNGCRWPTAMVNRLVKAFNETDDPPPRAKLESRPIDIEKYPGRRLLLRVSEVHALGGGGYTGPKWMTMSGELREGKALVASFESHSSSGRGLTTCGSVDSLSDSTSEMIVKWLRSPTLGAKLK